MDAANINSWIEKFKKAWLDKDFPAIRELFGHTAEYYERPESEPFRNIDEIMAVWRDIAPLSQQKLDVKIKSIEGTDAVMDWSFSCHKPDGQPLGQKGTYLVKFDDTGSTCLRFVQKVES